MKNNWITPLFKKCWIRVCLTFFVFILGIYLLRKPLFSAAGKFLITESELMHADAIYILSGGPDARARQGAKLYFFGFAPQIYCTGENKHEFLKLYDIDVTEAELTRMALKKEGVHDSVINLVEQGTSTREEALIIVKHAQLNQFKNVLVVSDKFHTRRIRYSFSPLFKKHNINLILSGAASRSYNENTWWNYENGLIMVNNEYIKLIYYWLKY